MNIRSKRSVQQVSVYDNGRGQIREINYQEPPSVPGWMNAPHKVILSDEGIWSFDKDGKELAFTENTASTSKEQNQDVQLLEYYIRNFIPPGKADLQRLSIPDAAIKEVRGSKSRCLQNQKCRFGNHLGHQKIGNSHRDEGSAGKFRIGAQ